MDISKYLLLLCPIHVAMIFSKMDILSGYIFVKHIQYILISTVFIAVSSISRYCSLDCVKLYKVMRVLLYLCLIFIVFQLLGIGKTFTTLINEYGIFNYGFRIGGPLIWSYELGFFLVPFIFSITAYMIIGSFTFKYCLLLLSCILITILTQSKSTYLNIVFNILIFMGYFSFRTIVTFKFNKKILFIALLFIFFFSAIILYIRDNVDNFEHIHRFFSGLIQGGLDASTRSRIRQISMIQHTIENNILFGYPFGEVHIENAYAYSLYRFGLVGLTLYLLLILFIIKRNYSIVRAFFKCNVSIEGKAISIGFLAFSISVITTSLSNLPLEAATKLGYLFWSLHAMYYAAANMELSKFKHVLIKPRR